MHNLKIHKNIDFVDGQTVLHVCGVCSDCGKYHDIRYKNCDTDNKTISKDIHTYMDNLPCSDVKAIID